MTRRKSDKDDGSGRPRSPEPTTPETREVADATKPVMARVGAIGSYDRDATTAQWSDLINEAPASSVLDDATREMPSDLATLLVAQEVDSGFASLLGAVVPATQADPTRDEGQSERNVRPAPPVEATQVGTVSGRDPNAVMLSQLEKDMRGGVELAGTGWNEGSFGDDALQDLERAFDEVAGVESEPAAEDAIRAASTASLLDALDSESGQAVSVPAPPDEPSIPPIRLRRSMAEPHLELSLETLRLATIPIGAEEISTPRGRPATSALPDELHTQPLDEDSDPTLDDPPRIGPHLDSNGATRVVNAVWTRLTPARVAVTMTVLFVAGGILGGLSTPDPDLDLPLSRREAIAQYARANERYDRGDIEEAVGLYRAAVSRDRSFGDAQRAQAASLAKLGRHKEAAAAYRAYLRLAPDASDAEEVKAILARYMGDDEP